MYRTIFTIFVLLLLAACGETKSTPTVRPTAQPTQTLTAIEAEKVCDQAVMYYMTPTPSQITAKKAVLMLHKGEMLGSDCNHYRQQYGTPTIDFQFRKKE